MAGMLVVIAVVALVGKALRPLLPKPPRWMRPFVRENREIQDEPSRVHKTRAGCSVICLFALSLAGLTLEVVALILAPQKLLAALLACAWVLLVS